MHSFFDRHAHQLQVGFFVFRLGLIGLRQLFCQIDPQCLIGEPGRQCDVDEHRPAAGSEAGLLRQFPFRSLDGVFAWDIEQSGRQLQQPGTDRMAVLTNQYQPPGVVDCDDRDRTVMLDNFAFGNMTTWHRDLIEAQRQDLAFVHRSRRPGFEVVQTGLDWIAGHYETDLTAASSTTGPSAPGDTPELAVCSGTIVLHGIGGFGPSAPVLHCDSPIAGYGYVYYGHAGPADQLPIGTHVGAGQVMSSIGPGIVGISTGPHLEIGFCDASGSPIGAQTAGTMMSLLQAAYAA